MIPRIPQARTGRCPTIAPGSPAASRGCASACCAIFEEDAPIPLVAKAALEAAFDVLRGLGAVLEDVRIRPAQVYHDVKITGAESELYAVHEPALRTPVSG